MAISPEVVLNCLRSDLLSQGLPFQGELWPGISIKEAAAISISNSLLKKFDRGRNVKGDAAALDKFLACNQACGEWSLPVDFDSKTETILGEVRQTLYRFWHRNGFPLFDSPIDILHKARIGPGANIKATGGDFYSKFFSSKLSCSDPALYRIYRHYASRFAEWSAAEKIRIEHFGDPLVVQNSRLSFVPKNDKISRCICTEPTLNTYFQLGIGEYIEGRLSEVFGILLSDQQFKNRDLARLGSITDGLSTIDLSSASDSISLKMLRYLLPSDFLNHLIKYRSPSTSVNGRDTFDLHMISTMGNGYTFPLQTMIFASVVVACMRFRGIPYDKSSSDTSWGVYGDDIICPRSCTADVIGTLRILGFSVNHDKTFVEGPFRESCGSDFFMGSDIRGIYIKCLDTEASRYSAINQLIRFSTKTGIFFHETIRTLLKTVRFRPVPRWEDVSSGIHCPQSFEAVRKLKRDSSIFGKFYKCLLLVC